MSKFPGNDALKPYVKPTMILCMEIAFNDNEENGVICLKIVYDLHKSFKSITFDDIPSFFKFSDLIYENFPVFFFFLQIF